MGHHDHDAFPLVDVGLKTILVELAVHDMSVHPPARKPRGADHLYARLKDVRETAEGDTLKFLLALVGKYAFQSRHRTLAAEFENPDGCPCEKRGYPHGDAVWNQIYESAEKPEKIIFEIYCKSAFLSHVNQAPRALYAHSR